MENIYVATTTLNFNNILSTESISPISIYEKRKFGYKRFEGVEPNNFNDIIIAYSKPPLFTILDEGLDSYPLVIQLSKDVIENIENIGTHKDVDIFKITRTIYMHPNKVKFLFLNDAHKKITLIKSESSIETKLTSLYYDSIQNLNKANSFDWDNSYLEKIDQKTFAHISTDEVAYTDNQLNSIKGFYYCYVLGDIFLRLESEKKLSKIILGIDLQRDFFSNNI